MKQNLILIFLLSLLNLFGNAQDAPKDMTDWIEVRSTADYIGVAKEGKFIWVLTEDNKGFHLHKVQREPDFTYLNVVSFDDKIDRTSFEYLRAFNVGGKAVFMFRGYDRSTKKDGLYSIYPGEGNKKPVKMVEFPERPLRTGDIRVTCHEKSNKIAVMYVPDLTSTKNQRTYFASIEGKRVITFLHKIYDHDGELVRYDDIIADESGGIYISARHYIGSKEAKDDITEDVNEYKPKVGYIPPNGQEIKWTDVPNGGKFIYDMKFVWEPIDAEVRMVSMMSEYNDMMASGMGYYKLSDYNESIQNVWVDNFESDIIYRAMSSQVSEFYDSRRGNKDEGRQGVYHLRLKEVFTDGDNVYPLMQEEKEFEKREVRALSNPYAFTDNDRSRIQQSSNDMLFFGSMWFMRIDDAGMQEYCFEERNVSCKPKDYEGYTYQVDFTDNSAFIYFTQDKVDHLRELGPLFEPTRENKLKRLEMTPGKTVGFKVLHEFRSSGYTPNIWGVWPEGGKAYYVEPKRKEFRVVEF